MSITGERVIADRYPATALRYLARLAAADGGYIIDGVSGWAHRRDVEDGTRMRMDGELPRLYAMGLVDRLNAGLGRTAKEAWVYRINDTGGRASADTWGEPFERVPAPGARDRARRVYVPPKMSSALELLRLGYEAVGPERFGGRGWRTGRELTAFVDQLNRNRGGAEQFTRLDSMDLKWLASVGLAEKRDEKLAWGRERPVVYWRISDEGRRLRVLEWREPRRDGVGDPR